MSFTTRILLYISIFYLNIFWATSQEDNRAKVIIHSTDKTFEIPLSEITPFLAYTCTWDGEDSWVKIRFSIDKLKWTSWINLSKDQHFIDRHKTNLAFTEKGFKYFQIDFIQSPYLVKNFQAHFYSPGDTPPNPPISNPIIGLRSNECECMQPNFLARSAWCPDGTCPEDPTPESTDITHLIVHHSAGTNLANDWAAIVRAIWSDHVNINGWDDIGYNWLIDPNGVIYEGRGYRTRGAHFCGMNSNTVGICVLGNFQNQAPTATAVNSLKDFLAWQSCDANIPPLSNSVLGNSNNLFDHISGHRDGCNTVCPGDQFYPMLGDIRLDVNDKLENVCGIVTSTEIVQNLYDFQISPNPIHNGIVNLEIRNGVQDYPKIGQVLSYNGQVLNSFAIDQNSSPTLKLDLHQLPSGLYFIKIGRLVRKLLVQ